MLASLSSPKIADHLPPEQLVKNYQEDQDTTWVYYLLRRYQNMIAAYSLRTVRLGCLQEDIKQELFVYLCKKLKKAQIHTNFTAWFLVVVRNFLIDLSKKENKRKIAQDGFIKQSHKEVVSNVGTKLDVDNLLERAKNELSDLQYQCLWYFFVEDLSYNQIAVRLNLGTKQVDNALRLAKTKLKKAYQTC